MSFSDHKNSKGKTVSNNDRDLKRNRYPYRLLLEVAPLHALIVIGYELAMMRARLANPRMDTRFAEAKELLVNVGCGDKGKDGWVNVDSSSAPGVDCVYDCRRRIPLASGSARAIFSEHLLEHLDYEEEAPKFLAECGRVLKPGGVLRLVVPDGKKYLMAYADGGWEAFRAFSPLVSEGGSGFRTQMEIVNAHFRQAGEHRFSYDYETLHHLLARCGFDEIREQAFRESRLDQLAIDAVERESESLYVEGTTMKRPAKYT